MESKDIRISTGLSKDDWNLCYADQGTRRMSDALLRQIADAIRTPPYVGAFIGPAMGITPFPPATLHAVTESEREIGQQIPPFLRSLYLEIGNGGFGPSYGLLGVAGGATDDLGHNAVNQWKSANEILPTYLPGNPPSPYPNLLPCIYAGCTAYLCVDCSKPDAQMWEYDPGNGDDWKFIFSPMQITLPELMAEWLRDKENDTAQSV